MEVPIETVFVGFAIAQAVTLYVIVQIGRNVLDIVNRVKDPAEIERIKRFHALIDEAAELAKNSRDLMVRSDELVKDVSALKEQIERMQDQSSKAPTIL